MSGFIVIHETDRKPVSQAILVHASEAAAWRGPDGGSTWIDAGIGLGHRRMETTPEDRGVEQPLASTDGKCRIVWDGRLDYREDLESALGLRPAGRCCDAAIVLAAYARWGTACIEHLEGDFAFVLWDGAHRRLLCGRDRFGIRPFHYHWDGRRFVGASETVQILAAGVPDAPNARILFDALAGQRGEFEESIYAAIRHLPPAHLLMIEDGRLTRRRYWSPDPRHTLRPRDPREAGDGFLTLLRASVHTRMRAIGPVAAHLSGGLDSSSIVCVAAAEQAGLHPPAAGLLTLSATYSGIEACDEAAYVAAVREATGVSYHPVPCDGIWPLDPPAAPLVPRGELSGMHVDAFNRAVYRRIDELGARVVLSGLGGDELLVTTPLFLADLAAHGRWGRVWTEAGRRPHLRRRLIWQNALHPLLPSLPAGVVDAMRRRRTSCVLPPWIRIDSQDRRRFARHPSSGRQPRRYAWRHGMARFLALTQPLFPELAADFEHAAFPYTVETRYPLLDARLLEYLMALSPEIVGRVDDRRFFHRTALADLLPESVRLRRDKANFVEIYHRALRDTNAARVNELLREPRLCRLPFFDLEGARRWYAEYLRSDTIEPRAFLMLFLVEAWLAEQDARRARVGQKPSGVARG